MSTQSSPPSPVGQDVPDLLSVSAEATARLDALKPKLPANFHFDWRGMRFTGRLEDGAPATLKLIADLGGVPFLAEDTSKRMAALELLRRRQGLSFARTVRNRMTLAMEEPLASANDTSGIITAITLALVKARPTIDAAQPLLAKSGH